MKYEEQIPLSACTHKQLLTEAKDMQVYNSKTAMQKPNAKRKVIVMDMAGSVTRTSSSLSSPLSPFIIAAPIWGLGLGFGVRVWGLGVRV